MKKAKKIIIEKGIPLPLKHENKRGNQLKFNAVLDKMEVGDSFIYGVESKVNSSCASMILARYVKNYAPNKKFTQRRTEDGKLRVWRIK